ncbi:TPA: hypothetical protein ACK3Q6_004484 [Burkholderia cepacia]
MDDLFSMALEARCRWALAGAYDPEITGDERDWWKSTDLSEEAVQLATEAGQDYPDEPCPHLLADEPPLCEAFAKGAALARQAEAEMIERGERDAARERKRQRVEGLLAAEDWDALGLPTPDELIEILRAGESTTVGGHFVVYDQDLDTVWYTSPYGIDGVVSSPFLVDDIKAFLIDMARGVEYGPIP